MLTDRSESSEIESHPFLTKLLFGHQPTPELLAILLVYAVQGILGISRLAVSFFLKDELALSPAEVAALMGIAALPWVIKPVFGFISDGLPIFGYRRRPYLILSGLLGVFAWLSLAGLVHTTVAATFAIVMTSLSVAVSDVIVDSLIVERARSESLVDSGSIQSLCWGAAAVGGLLTAYFSGLLLEHFSTRTVFAITAVFPLLVSAAAWLISEEPVTSADGERKAIVTDQIQQLWAALSQKAIWMPTLFLFLWQCTPTAESAFFYFSTNELGFTPEFLGRVRLVTSLASLFGVWFFQRFLKTIPFRQIFVWTTLFSSLLGLTALLLVTHTNRALGIDDHWFALGDSLILTVMGQLTFMPVLILAARLCPPGIEATLFAMLMSVLNLSGLVSKEGGAILTHLLGVTDTNFDKLWLLVLITNLGSVLPLVFIKLLPNEDPQLAAETHRSIPPASALEHPQTGIVGNQSFIPNMSPELLETKPKI
ncbi:folate/biopterin family MFS transporter [Chamaesiphon sp. VAR_48_metabat_135_sub]|uniref:folate/biopterin family MFS transporter n=1 Tax=Chamaesiphon sp. VAR_48_metabat_135_sub TaxID=2964699 RepID=UPI00286C4DBB|nr:folate/biopterin family MFS transporter [Chamaesiphon sp. VAR_48_metabat_135_sub]